MKRLEKLNYKLTRGWLLDLLNGENMCVPFNDFEHFLTPMDKLIINSDEFKAFLSDHYNFIVGLDDLDSVDYMFIVDKWNERIKVHEKINFSLKFV